MTNRIKGIVSGCTGDPREISSWKVKIRDDKKIAINGKEIAIASTHNNISLAIGLPVDFIIVYIQKEFDSIESALDVIPIDPNLLPMIEQIEEADQLNRIQKEQATSNLWQIVKDLNPDIAALIKSHELSGSGGPKHKVLQRVIKNIGEERGYVASLEHTLPEGGRVDVSLIKGEVLIACEVVISNLQGEAGNIKKCLLTSEPEYSYVISIYENEKSLNWVKQKILSTLNSIEAEKVFFFLIEDFIIFMDNLEKSFVPTTIQKIKGYTVRVTYASPPITQSEIKKQEEIRRFVTNVVMKNNYRRVGSGVQRVT